MFSRRIRKAIAVFLLTVFIQDAFAPAVAYALTAGPTAPEATSFEPVDTTDMVNLPTGDFVYNLPLLEVPGPAGSYPLSLSYHAGIQPDQDASWVGLGFSLNPGAITRLVNGYPDDHKSVGNIDRVFWQGGETTTATVGVSVGVANVATVSASMTFANDTYRGRSQGSSVGAGIGLGNEESAFGAGIGASFGVNPYGGYHASLGVSASVGGQGRLSASAGLSYNSGSGISAGAGVGVSVMNASLMDVSIASGQTKGTLSVGGMTSGVYNSKSGNVSVRSDGFNVDIPVYIGVNIRLGRSYQRYWIDESEEVSTFGSLYVPGNSPEFSYAFDAYDLLDIDLDIAEHSDPEKVLGGSYPDYDHYTVTAQGLGGNIQPYYYQKYLFRQDKKRGNTVFSRSYLLKENEEAKPVEFRFVNDFSNRFEYDPPDFSINGANLSFLFSGQPKTGESGTDGFVNNNLIGSRHVQWFTNTQILRGDPAKDPYQSGFIETDSEGFVRSSDTQLGGFTITNANGMKYHYALPAYSYEEYMRTQKYDEEGRLSYNEVKKPERYAYSWYLTGMTGPDYVDRNNNGRADQGDYGYWVNFVYKKWMNNYQWRNPGEGFNRDVDGEFEFFSSGRKEIYYLERVMSPTHVAVFEKSERIDGREVTSMRAGGFEPGYEMSQREQCYIDCDSRHCFQGTCDEPALANCLRVCDELHPAGPGTYTYPRPTLKLDRIALYNYDDYISGNAALAKSLRAIEFNYDYSLIPGSPDSYEQTASGRGARQGKLTLRAVRFLGKEGASLIPPMSFGYAKNKPYKQDARDMWGFYKNDYVRYQNENLSRLTTDESAADVDAWALTSITSSLGAAIDVTYESDSYKKPALYKSNILAIRKLKYNATNKSLVLAFYESSLDLSDDRDILEKADLELLVARDFVNIDQLCRCAPNLRSSPFEIMGAFYNYHNLEITSDKLLNVWADSIEVRDDALFDDLYSRTESRYTETKCHDRNESEYQPIIEIHRAALISGNVVLRGGDQSLGGGLRVKEIGVTEALSHARSVTTYEYTNGTTTYEPVALGQVTFDFGFRVENNWEQEHKRIARAEVDFKKVMYKNFSNLLGVSRTLPGPGVVYEFVTLRQRKEHLNGQTVPLPNYTTYQFEVFKEGMIGFDNSAADPNDVNGNYDGLGYVKLNTKKIILKDYTSRIGSLKTVTTYATAGNLPVSEARNHYLHDQVNGTFAENKDIYEKQLLPKYKNQGVIEESFARARIVLYKKDDAIPYPADENQTKFGNDQRHLLGVVSKKETFPFLHLGSTTKNFKTGIVTESRNVAFDFYSGEVVSALNTDSYGNTYLDGKEPAYRKYSGMGPGVLGGANMLTQVAGEHTVRMDGDTPSGLVRASVQTWTDQVDMAGADIPVENIWRKHAGFRWNGDQPLNKDGTYPIAHFNANPFNFAQGTHAQWEKTGEITLYDIYSHALENRDINGTYSATRMSNDFSQVLASATSASYDEIAYSGAENFAGNTDSETGVSRGDGNPSSARAHTGKFSLLVGFNSKGFTYTLGGQANLSQPYRASVWVYAPGEAEVQPELDKIQLFYSVNGEVKGSVHPILQKNKSKSWYLLYLDIPANAATGVLVGCQNASSRGVYFDDFRVSPLRSTMSSFVYDQTGELSYILDANNLYMKFEYDKMGRLTRTSRELLNFDFGSGTESFRADKTLNEFQYNYGGNK